MLVQGTMALLEKPFNHLYPNVAQKPSIKTHGALACIHGAMEPRGSLSVSLSTGTFCLLACGCQHKADVSKVVPR